MTREIPKMNTSKRTNAGGKLAGKPPVATYFAPAERASTKVLKEDTDRVLRNPLFRAVQETMDGYLMILNRQRQVLAVNDHLLKDLGYAKADCLVGKRPGEVIGCVHSGDGPGGCGTSVACSTCGAVLSILASQEKDCPVGAECLASVRRNSHIESAEFRIRATPVKAEGESYTVIVFNDISGAKRREALERVFFHDILNTLSGLHGWSQLLRDRFETIDAKDAAGKIATLSARLVQEIRDQRELLRAETGDLIVNKDLCPVGDVFRMLQSVFAAHEAAEGRILEVDGASAGDVVVHTDLSLLLRVLVNMVKNALEASDRGDRVRVWYEARDSRPVFLVHNRTTMRSEVALQVFKRSFSTREGTGRGIGTYSMKLFGERYLKGSVDFESVEGKGTTFWISLPESDRPTRR